LSRNLTVLVLGVGGTVSQGILKALDLMAPRPRVVGACVSHLSAGLYTTDRAYVSPYAADPDFPTWLEDICRREEVDAVLSGVEPVLDVLAAHVDELRERTGAIAVVSAPSCLTIGQDKLETACWLADQGLNAPRSADAGDTAEVDRLLDALGYPLIAKPRLGKAAQGVMEIRTDAELAYARQRPGYVVQESLGDPGGEYTVACFSDIDGQLRGTFSMHRELAEGTTYRARVGEYPEVTAEARRIAAALKPAGPANVQLRLVDGRPVCFEINVRFSGTAPIRARLGFNDVEAALRQFVLGEEAVDLPLITAGPVALRYWNELYVDPQAAGALERDGRLDDPAAHPLAIEDYGIRE